MAIQWALYVTLNETKNLNVSKKTGVRKQLLIILEYIVFWPFFMGVLIVVRLKRSNEKEYSRHHWTPGHE
jgi:hypothetical protein